MDMVMLGKMCVCEGAGFWTDRWFLCPGGLEESRGHVSTLHGWQKHTLSHTHTACVVGIKDNDSEKHLRGASL